MFPVLAATEIACAQLPLKIEMLSYPFWDAAIMALTQSEADALLKMPKAFVDPDPLDFTQTQPMNYDRLLQSVDRREQFLLTLERGKRQSIRLKFQTRARKVIVLARLDLNGPAHRNPPDSPYRPSERIAGAHMHLYQENFEDRIAYEISDVPGFMVRDLSSGVSCFEDFLLFVGVTEKPTIQLSI